MNYIQILYLCILKQHKRDYLYTYPCCELHSNLVSLHSETTRPESLSLCLPLWITFKSCIFAFWNNYFLYFCITNIVVNYIQILYLCILKQLAFGVKQMLTELWITFKSCIFAFWNNLIFLMPTGLRVVNYIQILYLCILKQLFRLWLRHLPSCELHSNLVSLHSETTLCSDWEINHRLWITFKSCIFAFWNNLICFYCQAIHVVNYIQILYLCILKQQKIVALNAENGCELHSNLVSLHSETTVLPNPISTASCELHSNLVSLHSETTPDLYRNYIKKLWITFKSCIFAFWNNVVKKRKNAWYVVNYIQILYLCILKQLLIRLATHPQSCELHSNLVSLHSETTVH